MSALSYHRVQPVAGWGEIHMIRMMVRAGYIGGKGKKGIYDFYREILTGTCPVPPRAG